VLFTGIKVIDLLEPYLKRWQIGLFGGAGVGKNSHYHGTDSTTLAKGNKGFSVLQE